MSEQTTTAASIGTIDAGRIYVRALLDQDGRATESHRAYAEDLVDQFYNHDDQARKVVRVALEAYCDGYEAGRNSGFKDGRRVAEESGRRFEERMRASAAHQFLTLLDGLDPAARRQLQKIATALNWTIGWDQGEEEQAEAPPAA